MPERRTELRVFQVEMICDKCLTGLMLYKGMKIKTDPPKYVHVCSHCDHRATYLEYYPYKDYEEVPDGKI